MWPKPQTLTELYFTDHSGLPKTLKAGSKHVVAFTVHNLEHAPTTYHYKVLAMSPNTADQQQLTEGTFLLNHDRSRIVQADITVPDTEPRGGIKVELYYKAAQATDKKEDIQTQSIHYWVAMTGGPAVSGELP